jgi:23S rRNA (adenine2503-C2)-methyltransferase
MKLEDKSDPTGCSRRAPDPEGQPLVSGKRDLKGMEEAEMVSFCESLGEPAYRGRQLFSWVYVKGEVEFERMTDLSKAFRQKLSESARVGVLTAERLEEGADGTGKYIWRLADGECIESVRIPMPGRENETRWALCVSTQVGCAMGCAFCLTARMGLVRQLSAGEIVEQFLAGARALPEGQRFRNVVFMGMGEPLDNFEATVKAVRLLIHPRGIALSPKRLTVSTVGITSRLQEFVRAVPEVGLAVSLHAADDATRSQIVPVNRKWGLDGLLKTCREFSAPERRRITFEYVLLKGVNDSPEDAQRLARRLQGVRCKINLLPWNPFPDAPFERPAPSRVEAFRGILINKGYTVTVRQSRGLDIRAACGQLVDEVKMAERVRRTSGRRPKLIAGGRSENVLSIP